MVVGEVFKTADPAELVNVGALDHVDGDVGHRQLLRQVPAEGLADVVAGVVEPRPGHDQGDHRDLCLVSYQGNPRPANCEVDFWIFSQLNCKI